MKTNHTRILIFVVLTLDGANEKRKALVEMKNDWERFIVNKTKIVNYFSKFLRAIIIFSHLI